VRHDEARTGGGAIDDRGLIDIRQITGGVRVVESDVHGIGERHRARQALGDGDGFSGTRHEHSVGIGRSRRWKRVSLLVLADGSAAGAVERFGIRTIRIDRADAAALGIGVGVAQRRIELRHGFLVKNLRSSSDLGMPAASTFFSHRDLDIGFPFHRKTSGIFLPRW